MPENVELIVRVRAEGQAVLAALRQAMGGLNQESKSTAAGVAQLDAVELKLSGTLRLVTSATNDATGAQTKHKQSMTESVLQGILLDDALQRVASTMKTATVEAAQYASRTEQLNVVMDQLARANGLSVTAVRAQADAVKNLGITTQESRATISQMIFAQLDLTKATDLARLAQNAAKIAGISSSEALSGILNGIKTQQIEVLRTYGIQVSFEQALTRGAAKLGKTRETLTNYERANIALNEVLTKGPRIMGTYEMSLTTTAGQMQSLTRHTEEAKNALGEQFAPSLQRTVEFLTWMAKGVRENADEVATFTTVLTTASLAAAAFRFTPGPPVVKGAAAAIVGGGALLLGNVDPVEAALDSAKDAIEKIEAEKRLIVLRAQKGQIKDREEFNKEVERLSNFQTIIEEKLADRLAQIYSEKRKKQEELRKNPPGAGTEPGLSSAYGAERIAIPDFNLGLNRKLSAAQVEAAINRIGTSANLDEAGLKFTPDPNAAAEAQFSSFQSKLKEAQQSATAGLERVRAGSLTGVERIMAERQAALAKVFEQFKPFEQSLKDGAEYQRLLGTIAKEYDILLEREKRLEKVDDIKRDKRLSDAKAQVQVEQIRQKAQQSQEIAAVIAEEGDREENINRIRKERLAIAQQEYSASQARNAAELKSAQDIFVLDKNKKALAEAEAAAAIAAVKTDAQLTKEKSDIEHDAQVAILKLRKEQRKELEQIYESARRIAETEQTLLVNRVKDNANRVVRLAQARALPGDERAVQEFQLKTRVDTAREEYRLTLESIQAQRKAATEAYIHTRDKVELERRAVELRQRELQAEYTLEKEIADARVDREIQIADIRRRQNEELRQSLGQLYDAARASGKVGIQEFFKGYIEQIKKTIFINLGEELFRGAAQKLGGIIPGQEKIDPVTGKGTGELTTLGRILRGTPLGVDPAKLAMDRQINSQDRNTKSLDRLTDAITGKSPIPGRPGGLPGASGGVLDQILGGSLGAILGLPGGVNPGVIIKNFAGGSGFGGLGFGFASSSPGSADLGGIDLRPDRGIGGFVTRIQDFIRPKVDPATGKGKFSAGNTALAAAAAVPGILAGMEEGGVKGGLGIASSALGAAASIPGPQQPFLMGAALLTGFIGMFMKSKKQKKAEELAARLNNKFQMPDSIEILSDLAGNSIDYNARGELRTFGNNTSNVTVNIQTLDSKSFFDRGPEIADSVMNILQLGHPLRGQIGEIAGVA